MVRLTLTRKAGKPSWCARVLGIETVRDKIADDDDFGPTYTAKLRWKRRFVSPVISLTEKRFDLIDGIYTICDAGQWRYVIVIGDACHRVPNPLPPAGTWSEYMSAYLMDYEQVWDAAWSELRTREKKLRSPAPKTTPVIRPDLTRDEMLRMFAVLGKGRGDIDVPAFFLGKKGAIKGCTNDFIPDEFLAGAEGVDDI
jgi:hypothetical protein